MADIVSSLFGLSPIRQEAEMASRARDLDIGTLIGQATTTGFMTPIQSQNYINRQGAQAALGGMAIRGLGSLFGLQDPQLQRATQLESILGETQMELGEMANDPTQFYPAIQQKLANAGFTREAMMAGQAGQKAIQEFGLNRAKVQTEQAQQRKLGVEAFTAEQQAIREEQLRQELAALPPNADEEAYLAIVRKYAPAKDVMSTIEKRQIAEEGRKAKLEEIKLRAEEQRQQLEMRLQDQRLAREDRIALQRELANQANATRLQIAELTKANRKASGADLSPAQKRVDAKFGEEYSNYIALGGKSVVDRQLQEIDDVISMIDRGYNISGKDVSSVAALGDTALSSYSKRALEARDKIGGVVQSNLRAILGGQFAQKEGEALLARAYNLAASPEDNKKRLLALRQQIADAVAAKEKSVQYYEDNGTLVGFKANDSKADPLGIR
jgi:hypothetical protein